MLVKKHKWLPHLLVALSFMLFIGYYMTPQVMHPTSIVYGFGDNTAGPIWRYQVSPQSPFWGHENITNYPYGESLVSPVSYSGTVQYVSYWLLAKVFGPILAYNLLNFGGLLLTAMIMYGFIYSLTRRRWIAWLAGYAVTFSPYYQMKIGGHPTYAFQGIFIGLIWLFYRLIKYRQKRDAIYLGLLTALSFYVDPYFVLLTMLVLLPLGLVWLFINRKAFLSVIRKVDKKPSEIKAQLKLFFITIGVACVLIMPLATIFYTQGKQINADVAASRGNVLSEARACSNWPHEYLVPFVLNPVFEKEIGKAKYAGVVNYLTNNFTCGIGEDSVGLSLTLVTIASLGSIVLFWDRINRRKIGLSSLLEFNPKFLLLGVGAVGLAALAMGLPPVRFHHIPTPSYELLSITTTWRTFTRVYVLVNIALVIIASVILAYIAHNFSKNKRLLIFGFVLIFVGIFIEYQSFAPFHGNMLSSYNYKTDPPSTYTWLKDQSSIKTVAEYPLEREGGESDADSYYLTMQSTHGKNLFNSALPTSPQEQYRTGLKNISDPQTIPVLKALGVDAVIIHGVPLDVVKNISFASVLHTAAQSPFNLLAHTPTVKNDNIVVISTKNAPKADYVVTLGNGFVRNGNIIISAAAWEYEAIQNSAMNVSKISNGKFVTNNVTQSVCFDVKMSAENDTDNLTLIADGVSVPVGQIDSSYRQVRVDAVNKVVLHTDIGHNMRVTKVGCIP